MRLKIGLFVCLAVFAAGGGAAVKERKLMEIQTPSYRVITSTNKEKALQYVQLLERFRQTLEVSLNRTPKPSSTETQLYLLTTEDWQQYFQPWEHVSGMFAHDGFVNYLLVEAGSDRNSTLQTIFHEYAHFVLDTQFTGVNHPAWLHEGFAQFLEGATFSKSQATLALPVERIFQLRASTWIPIERVLAVDMRSAEYSEKDMAPTFYGECWALIHYAVSGEPSFWGRLRKYLLAVDEGQPIGTAFREHLQMEPAQLDKILQEYINRKSLPTLIIDLAPQPAVQVQALRNLDANEGAIILAEAAARIALQKQDKKAGRIQPLLDTIPKDSPWYPRALALSGLVATASGEDAQADDYIAQVARLTTAPDAATAKILGSALLFRVLFQGIDSWPSDETLDSLRRARNFYSAAHAANPKDIEAVWGFGLSSVWSDTDTRKAVELLKTAYAGAPDSDYLALATAMGYERLNQPQVAQRYWKDAVRLARETYLRKMAERALARRGDNPSLPAGGITGPLAKKYVGDIQAFSGQQSEQGYKFKGCAAKSNPLVGSVLDGKQAAGVITEMSAETDALEKIYYLESIFSDVLRTYYELFAEHHPACESEFLSAMEIEARIAREIQRLIPLEVQKSKSSQFKARAVSNLKNVTRSMDTTAGILQAHLSRKSFSPRGAKQAAEIVAGMRKTLESTRKAIDTYPATPDEPSMGGVSKNDPSQYEAAKTSYREAVKRTPNDPRLWFALGQVCMFTHEYRNAVDAFTRAIELNPKFWPAWSDRAAVREALGQRAEAIKDAKMACDNNYRFACDLEKELSNP